MQLISVNLGKEQPLVNGRLSPKSGIFKDPVAEPATITEHGLLRDVISDLESHGGVDQAVHVYGMPDYAWWSHELGRELAPGSFGENLTVSELTSDMLNIGDRLHVGSVLLEITAPRIPCFKLAARMNDPKFVKRFRFAERPGVYCRVLQPGQVRAGDAVMLERYAGEPYSAVEMFRAWYDKDLSEADLRRQLAAPIAIRARNYTEDRLAAMEDLDPAER
jgi:MOSC domain-containing protein YiiM